MRINLSVMLVGMAVGVSAWAQEAAPILTDLTMDAGDGKQLVDKGPLGLKGQLTEGVTLVDGKAGKALHFSGKEEPVKFDSHWTIDNLSKQFSLSVWIKPEQRPQGDIMFIVAKRPGWWTGTPYAMGYDRDGRISAVCNDGNDHWIHSNAPMETGQWHQVVLTHEAGKQFSMYVDSVLQNERAGSGKLRGNTEPLTLGYVKGGNFPGGNYQAYKGGVDELRVFPVCLTDAQVKQEFVGKLATRPAEKKDYPVRGMDPKTIPAEASQPPATNTPLECSITFDQQPKAQGMWYESPGGDLREVEVDGKKTWCLVAGQAMGMPWARSAKFTLTDPRFKNGKAPAADFELTYMDKAWAPVDMAIDAKGGSRKIGGGWQSTKWTTARVSVDDAYFGNRDFGNPDNAILSDGYDLRVNGFNEDLCIRSIKIVGHDRSAQVEWSRMLKLTGITGEAPLLVYPRKAKQSLTYRLENLALKDAKLAWTWQLQDYAGKAIQKLEGSLVVAGEMSANIAVKFDTDKLPLGPYTARLETTIDNDGAKQPLIQRTTKLGVISDTQLEKAAKGEFLYGICPQETGANSAAMAWCKTLGVDIVRGGDLSIDKDNTGLIDAWLAQGVQPMFMCDPPQDTAPGQISSGMDPAKRQGLLRDLNAKLEAFAKKSAGKVTYYELGNEPDLRFFYRGPIEEYVDSFKTMRKAIKKGNPDAVVMNGGLCFFGAEGDQRARKLISLMKPDDLDALAYHGHGPGVKAERDAFNRSRDEAAKYGLEKLPYVETESGLAADSGNPGELMLQARTVVQKMVYAQSTPTPAFFWFALLIQGGDAGYTTTEEGAAAPRPAALAYRTMVEQLRHMKFQQKLDLKGEALEGYLFDGAGGKKTLVAWSNQPSITDVSIQLDSPKAAEIRQADMFGNSVPPRTQAGGFLNVFVGVDPVFVSWTSSGQLAAVKTVDSMIAADMPSVLFTGMPNVGYVVVRNPSADVLKATLNLEAYSRVGIRAEPASVPVELNAGETKRIAVTMTLGEATAPLRMPRWWRVFAHTSPDKVDLAKLTAIPAELPGQKAVMVKGTDVLVTSGTVNLSSLGNGSVEKDPAILLTTLYVPQDTTLKVGAGADWWMAWYCNGQKVFDTLATGNNGAADRLKYTFDLPLKAGNNTIGVVVLSGSGGWGLTYGTEKQIAITNSGGIDPDRLVCKLVKDGKQFTEQVIPLEIERPSITVAALQAEASAWQLTEPVAVFDSLSITNLFEKFPQSDKWYKGEADLSGAVWVGSERDTVTFAVSVRDEKFVAPASADKLAEGDSVELRLTDDSGKVRLQLASGLVNDKPVVKQTGTHVAGVEAAISRQDNVTFYRITMPRALVGKLPAKLAIKLLDNDGFGLKQHAIIKGRTGEEGVRIALN